MGGCPESPAGAAGCGDGAIDPSCPVANEGNGGGRGLATMHYTYATYFITHLDCRIGADIRFYGLEGFGIHAIGLLNLAWLRRVALSFIF